MKLKIFVHDFKLKNNKKTWVPPLHPFISSNLTLEKKIEKYGKWFINVQIVDTIEKSDIVMPAQYVNYYFYGKKINELLKFNEAAYNSYKYSVCFTNGDWGVTPPLKNFHLYRFGGYLSKNNGNQFCMPFFLRNDPIDAYYNGTLSIHKIKPDRPVIGFCGRASNNLVNVATDVTKNVRRLTLKLVNRWPEDIEIFQGSSFKRFQMLKEIERSDLIDTNFIIYNKFQGGGESVEDKEKQRKIFFQNIKESHYTFCYRGWGNYSIRLYETMASGRIPIIVTSNNNFPFTGKINWDLFPIIKDSNSKNIAKIVADYHSKLTNEQFVALQLAARKIWEDYLTYKGFMQKWVDNYILDKIEQCAKL
jgi:hypothetical protein